MVFKQTPVWLSSSPAFLVLVVLQALMTWTRPSSVLNVRITCHGLVLGCVKGVFKVCEAVVEVLLVLRMLFCQTATVRCVQVCSYLLSSQSFFL